MTNLARECEHEQRVIYSGTSDTGDDLQDELVLDEQAQNDELDADLMRDKGLAHVCRNKTVAELQIIFDEAKQSLDHDCDEVRVLTAFPVGTIDLPHSE